MKTKKIRLDNNHVMLKVEDEELGLAKIAVATESTEGKVLALLIKAIKLYKDDNTSN